MVKEACHPDTWFRDYARVCSADESLSMNRHVYVIDTSIVYAQTCICYKYIYRICTDMDKLLVHLLCVHRNGYLFCVRRHKYINKGSEVAHHLSV